MKGTRKEKTPNFNHEILAKKKIFSKKNTHL